MDKTTVAVPRGFPNMMPVMIEEAGGARQYAINTIAGIPLKKTERLAIAILRSVNDSTRRKIMKQLEADHGDALEVNIKAICEKFRLTP